MKTRRSRKEYTFDPSIAQNVRYERDIRRAIKASLEDIKPTENVASKPDVATTDVSNDTCDTHYTTTSSSKTKPISYDDDSDSKESSTNEYMSKSCCYDIEEASSQVSPKSRTESTSPLQFLKRRDTTESTTNRIRKRARMDIPKYNLVNNTKPIASRNRIHQINIDPYYHNLYQRELKKAIKESLKTHEKESETQEIEKKSLVEDDEIEMNGIVDVESAGSSVSSSVPSMDTLQDTCVMNLESSVLDTSSSTSSSCIISSMPSTLVSSSSQHKSTNILTFGGFCQLWKRTETVLSITLEDLENKYSIRSGNNHRDKRNITTTLSNNQTRAMYGRTLFKAMEQIACLTKLKKNEIFLDIGHGLGNAVLQAAFTIGCESRGVEVVPERCRIADRYSKALHEIVADLKIRNHGKVELREGSLTDEKHRQFMIEADVVLVNNAGHVFGVRSGNLEGKPTLDEYVSGLFAMMKPGTRMVTFEPLLCLGRNLSDENEMRRKNNLVASPNASFFTCSRHNLGERSVGWTDKEVYVHLYTRVREAMFLCCNPKCEWNNEATAAVDENTGLLVDECVYCGTPRPICTRKYR